MTGRPGSTLLCIELPGQVPQALEAMRKRGISDFTVLALTPHVEYALKALDRPCQRPEDYHSEEDINEVGFNGLDVLEKFCGLVDEFLQSRWDLLKEHSIGPARINWYNLDYLLSGVGIAAFIMRRVLETENPQRVFFFGTREDAIPRELYFVQESVWSRVIPVASNALAIQCDSIADNTDPTVLSHVPDAQRVGLKGMVRTFGQTFLGPRAFALARAGYNKARLAKERLLALRPGIRLDQRPTILTLDQSYSVGHLLRRVQADDRFNIVHWDVHRGLPPRTNGRAVALQHESLPSKRDLQRQGRRLWSEFRKQPEFQKPLQFSDMDCFSIIERRLRQFFEVDLSEIVLAFLKARILIRSTAPFAVLAATMGDYTRQAVALAARREQVPFIVYRHGAGGGYVRSDIFTDPVVGQIEHQMVDYILTFGQGDVDYYKKLKNARAKTIAVGSAALDDLKRSTASAERGYLLEEFGLRTDRRTVLYVPTTMDGNLRVAPYRGRSPSRMFAIESRIIEVFTEFPDTQFVVKLPTSPLYPCSPIAQVILDQEVRNCVVITEPLTYVLPLADMFVFDYSSTSFFEALTTDKPILFCSYQYPIGWAPEEWPPQIEQMWNERVSYSGDLEEFLELLRTNLREERFQLVKSDDTFLKLFGTHLDDGKSAERAYEFLESLVGNGEPHFQGDTNPIVNVGPAIGRE